MADSFKVPPSEIMNWSLSDITMMQSYWSYQMLKRDESQAKDSPEKMAQLFGGK